MYQTLDTDRHHVARQLLSQAWDQTTRIQETIDDALALPGIVGVARSRLTDLRSNVLALKAMLQEADSQVEKMLPMSPGQ